MQFPLTSTRFRREALYVARCPVKEDPDGSRLPMLQYE